MKREKIVSTITAIAISLAGAVGARGENAPVPAASEPQPQAVTEVTEATFSETQPVESTWHPEASLTHAWMMADTVSHHVSPYSLPYSRSFSTPDWHRLWVNTSVLVGAYVTTLGVLELLPEDATAWNRADIQRVAPFNRWYRNIFKWGPEWDHDNAVFNYLLHPYAGAVYFMSARSCGFNFAGSLLYSSLISTFGWEFGIEAFMERPSYQDLVITPVVGSLIGEGFYLLKRKIVADDYRLAGSKVLGNVVAFLIDPVNEVVGLFAGNDCRHRRFEVPDEDARAYTDGDTPRRRIESSRAASPQVSSTYWASSSGAGIAVSIAF